MKESWKTLNLLFNKRSTSTNIDLLRDQIRNISKLGVSPIFKDGYKTEKSNYRPILVLPVVSRLFEKLVFNQLYKYLNDKCLINSNQSGFRELHSTVTCLLKNTDD